MLLSDLRREYLAKSGANEADIVSIVDGFAIAPGNDIEISVEQKITFIQRGVLPPKDELEELMVSRHTPGVHQKVKQASVAICGLGGLGSNIAIALARIGVGHLTLIDFDVVEPSNLNRQQYFVSHLGMKKTIALKALIQEINPYVNVTAIDARIEADNAESLLKDCDIICEAFDNPKAKAMLAEVCQTVDSLKDKPYVGASGLAGYNSSNTIQTKKLKEGFYIAGDLTSAAGVGQGLMAPRVLVAAGHQANMILRLILKEFEA